MAQKADVEQTFEAAELGPTCYVEDDSIEEVVQEQRQQISLGNGGYITCARAMSDDL